MDQIWNKTPPSPNAFSLLKHLLIFPCHALYAAGKLGYFSSQKILLSSLFFSSCFLLHWNVLATSFWIMWTSLPASATLAQSIWPLASLKDQFKYHSLQDPKLRSALSSSLQQEVISPYFLCTPTTFHFTSLFAICHYLYLLVYIFYALKACWVIGFIIITPMPK